MAVAPLATDQAVSPARQDGAGQPALRFSAAVRYALRGDVRFVSHHDELRMLSRAMARARWPVSHSQGFNPRARLAIPLPRPVAMASECQLALIELAEARSARELFDALSAQMPGGCVLREVLFADGVMMVRPRGAIHEVVLSEEERRMFQGAKGESGVGAEGETGLNVSEGQLDGATDAARAPSAALPLCPSGSLPLRLSGDRLLLETPASLGGARLTQALLEIGLRGDALLHRVRRIEVIWDQPPVGRESWPAAI
ncbi:MAG: TIGR03936 family radical SAM-associated protein [Phycisphaerae bacterium]